MLRKFFLLATVLLATSICGTAQSHSNSEMARYVEQAAEFSSRARANVYFSNAQSIFNGVQVSFVNVGAGNLTFTRRDLVASGRIPIVVARVYDSAESGSPDFGPGWRLSAAETISVADNKAHLITENGSTLGFVTTNGRDFQLERDFPSDYSALVKTATDTFQASLRTGFQKEFKLIGDQFRLVKVTDRNGNEMRLSYANSQLAKIENANHWIRFTRDGSGRVVQVQDDQQRKVSYVYDAQGRLIEADDLGGHAWKYQYTDENRLAAAIDPLRRSNFTVTFDDSGRVRRLELPSGTIQYSYDPENGLTTVIDRRKLISRFYQNEEGITTRAVNALGEETAIALDNARNVTSLSRNGSVVEAMQYDSQHHIISRQSSGDSGTVQRQYSYDSATGLLTAIHTNNSDDQAFSYDARGNLTNASLPDGVHSFSFSATGDLNSFSDQGSKLTFTSDPDGLVASMADEKMALASFQYKAGAQLAAATIPGWSPATYEYQPSGLRSKMTYKNGSRVEYSYDPAGNLTATRVFDRKGKQINGQTLEMDSSYRLVRWVLFNKTETTFRYDPNGNLTEIKKNKSITRFEYDALDRLTAVITPDHRRLTYTYKSGERSLIEQYQHASVNVADLRDTGLTFGNSFNSVTSRPLTAPLGSMRFSETLGAFQLANADGSEIVRPQEAVETALGKLYLFQAGMTQKALRSGFGAPFNAMFIPAEYLTINCCPECYFDGSEWYCPPCSGGGGSAPSLYSIDPGSAAANAGTIGVNLNGAFSDVIENINISGSGVSAPPNAQVDSTGTVVATTFTIESTAAAGGYDVYVDDSFGTSNSVTFTVTPVISSISPAQGLVGAGQTVTITGAGFASGATINAGSNISVSNISVSSSTQMTATFTPANSTSAGGNQSVTLTVNGQQSNSRNFFVQVPTDFSATSVVQDTNPNDTACPSGSQGYFAIVSYQLTDQNGSPIQVAGLTPQEKFSVNGTPALPQFTPFATPQTTPSSGAFEDKPVGSCITIVPGQNLCVNVVQTFNILVPTSGSGSSVAYSITTQTTRRDCQQGIKVTVNPGSTFTLGTVN